MLRQLTCMAIGTLLAASVWAEETEPGSDVPNPGMDILKKADQILKDTRTLSYSAELTVEGWVDQYIKNASGKALLTKEEGVAGPMYRMEIEMADGDDSATRKLTTGCDGENFYLIDPAVKTAYQDIDPAVAGEAGDLFEGIQIRRFNAEEPFKRELAAEHVELRGESTVEGEPCHEVLVQFGDRGRESVWYISKKGHMFHKVEQTYVNPDGEKSTAVLLLSHIELNPRFAKNPFVLSVPAGFTKTDEFAP